MNQFVFVVCGGKEHIAKLNFSLKFLTHFSNKNIIVVTDLSRNEAKINHDNILNVNTPEYYDNHKASIYLKTSLHKCMPNINDDTYCYLDSDIISISEACDQIFNHQPEPVIFAKDHDVFSSFSPYAMNCNCLMHNTKKKDEFNNAMQAYFDDYKPGTTESMKALRQLNAIFDTFRSKPLKYILHILRYLFLRYLAPLKNIRLGRFTFNKHNRCWYDESGNMISFDYNYHKQKLWDQQKIYYKNENWYNSNNETITPRTPECQHLQEYIAQKYKIKIPSEWRHWNGGVFLFNKNSVDFMDYWHKISLQEFKSNDTATRDQATLAVCAWKFGLQYNKTLPIKYNFIAEYTNPAISWNPDKGYTYNGFKSSFQPVMLHIYHHWGDTNWSIWQSVIKTGKEAQCI